MNRSEMGVITIVMDDGLERRLRERAAQLHGSRKGALGLSVQEAVEAWLRGPVAREESEKRLFRAHKGGRILVEDGSLRKLIMRLRSAGIDPRSVEIRSSEALKEVARMGARFKRA